MRRSSPSFPAPPGEGAPLSLWEAAADRRPATAHRAAILSETT